MVESAQRVMPLEMPVSVGEHAFIRPRRDHFADEQIVRTLVVRLGNQSALQPACAAFQQRRFNVRTREGLQTIRLEFIQALLLGDVQP